MDVLTICTLRCMARALLPLLALLLATPSAFAAGDHEHDHTISPPPPSDVRFMPGTTGPVVFRGTAATVSIPDGYGFGGEKGRTQNSADRRKNNYSVTDANFNNVLGLLPRHPDTGQPLTYVQHIQTYAAAGFLETFAPATYAVLVQRQNAGTGTVLGAAAYLMGLVTTADPAAAGVDRGSVPPTLPGTGMSSELYVRSARDATGQTWARMHHAQTAPAVYRMLVAAGVPPTSSLILASDDGISGAGRLNGVNEQDNSDGFNSGERATWALAAQVAQQSGVPVVLHMMHGHDHAGIDASALTRPRINPIIGFAADDRSASEARAAAVQRVLTDGTVASAATAAADQNLVVRNDAFLKNETDLHVHMQWFDYMQRAGAQHRITVTVENHGPHVAKDVTLQLDSTRNVQFSSLAGPGDTHCHGLSCHIGDMAPDSSRSRRGFAVTVRFTAHGESDLWARLSTRSSADADDLATRHGHAASTASRAAIGYARSARGWKVASCGSRLARACSTRLKRGIAIVTTVRPGREGTSGRWVKAVYQQRKGRRWVTRFDRWGQVDAAGRVRLKADRWTLKRKGMWRVRVQADKTWLLGKASSRYLYVKVR